MKQRYVMIFIGIAAVLGGWCYVERRAAHALMAEPAANAATRRTPGGTRRGWQGNINGACRSLCEPHCRERWGSGSLTGLLREGCFRNCIDVVCAVTP